MKIEGFGVESWLNEYERQATVDISQSTISSMTVQDVLDFEDDKGVAFLENLKTEKMNYGWIEGSLEFKAEISKLYKNVPADNILQTNGATGGNFVALYSILHEGDEVVAMHPAYQQNYDIPKSFGCQVKFWEIKEDNAWLPEIADLENLVTSNTKMITITNANNPTGAFMDKSYLEKVVEIAKKADAYVLVDEVYMPLDESIEFASIADLYEKGIAVNSMSKTFSLPGTRIGWIATQSKELADLFRNCRDYTMICGGVFNDAFATLAMKHRDKILDRNRRILKKNLQILIDWVNSEKRASLIPPKMISTSCVKLDIPVDDEEFCLELLNETGTLLVPGSRFELPGHVRLGYATDEATLKLGLNNLSQALHKFD